MSDSASRKSETQISKFAASQTAGRRSQPTIGDLSAIPSGLEGQKSAPMSVGDIKEVNPATDNDVLGDITLLEEAFAEMEDSVNDIENVTPEAEVDLDDDIPMLHSTIEQPSVMEQAASPDIDASIPVLDQAPSELIEPVIEPANESVHAEAEIPEIPTLSTNSSVAAASSEPAEVSAPTTFSEPVVEIKAEAVSEAMATSEANAKSEAVAASEPLTSTSDIQIPTTAESPSESVESELFKLSGLDIDSPADLSVVEMPPVVTTFDAMDDEIDPISDKASDAESIWAEELVASSPVTSTPAASTPISEPMAFSTPVSQSEPMSQPVSQSKVGDVFSAESVHTSIEEKIAQASGDTAAVSGLNDIPLANEQMSGPVETELAPGFVEEFASAHTSGAISEPLNVSSAGLSKPLSEVIPPAQQANQHNNEPANGVSMSIPFELHSQLSKKIDELVLDATMSLTTELEQQLSQQLESLLGHAVEAVLPKLIDQMANELRNEVKGRVKQQLPTIVNDVLGKTRLS